MITEQLRAIRRAYWGMQAYANFDGYRDALRNLKAALGRDSDKAPHLIVDELLSRPGVYRGPLGAHRETDKKLRNLQIDEDLKHIFLIKEDLK